jgi:hypothetical protein
MGQPEDNVTRDKVTSTEANRRQIGPYGGLELLDINTLCHLLIGNGNLRANVSGYHHK